MVATPGQPTGPIGLADTPPEQLGLQVLTCWDLFLDVVRSPSTDLTLPSRLPGWSGADTCIHLGSWPDSRVLDAVLASARSGDTGGTSRPDADNDALVAAHADAPVELVVAALLEARDRLAAFFASDDAVTLGRATSRSAVGPLPVLGLVHAGCYELAVHALDLAPCGAPAPDPQLLDRGLAALIDVTGALASRAGVELTLTGQAADGGWRFTSRADGWTTGPTPPGRFAGTGVRGSAADLLDTSAGRRALPSLLLTRRLVVQQLPSFLRLAPLLDEVPGLPGGAALKGAVGGLTGVGRSLGRLPGLRR